MFDVAFSELVVIGIVALIVLGPKRLQEVARTAGRWMGKIRNFVENAKRDMNAELRRDELAELRQVKDQLLETKQVFEQAVANPLASTPDIRPPALAAIPEASPSPRPVRARSKTKSTVKKKKPARARRRGGAKRG